jgi:serine/threonine protein kinase
MLAPGARIGPFEVLALLGEGGMGEVYRARHTALRREVALKTLPEMLARQPERLARLRRGGSLLNTPASRSSTASRNPTVACRSW